MQTSEVIKHFEGVVKTASALNITQPAVSNWGEKPPLMRQYQIERLTKGELKAEDPATA